MAEENQELSVNWLTVLRDLDKCADAEHTVMHLPYSSSWIFSTPPSCRWCVDPFPRWKMPAEDVMTMADELCKYDFCITTHLHRDHFWPKLLDRMAELGKSLKFIMPENIVEEAMKQVNIPKEKLIVVSEYDKIEIGGIKLKFFPGFHCEPGMAPVESCSFVVELPDGIKLAFPIDVRNYSQKIPEEMKGADYLFAHVWLGRNCSDKDEFPFLDDFCRFCLVFRPGNIFLGHLLEYMRPMDSRWTERHYAIVKSRFKDMAPKMRVHAPRHGSGAVLAKSLEPDYYEDWSTEKRAEFASELGCSFKGDFGKMLDISANEGVECVEVRYQFMQEDEGDCLVSIAKWRKAGGRVFSLHLPTFSLEDNVDYDDEQVKRYGFDRVTEHVPKCSVEYMDGHFDEVVSIYLKKLAPLLEGGIAVGIENMHMKAGKPSDNSRGYGFTIDEWMRFVQSLRQKAGTDLIGLHLDIGHAYTNYPFHCENTVEKWIRSGGKLINAMHVHQYTCDRSPANLYPSGHQHVSGRLTGFPKLEPLYRLWQDGMFRCPMFLEVNRGPEENPIASRHRLLDAWTF